MSKQAQRPKNRASTEARILKAVEKILVDEGGKAVSISRVVREAGVARTLVYRYFGSVEGLMTAYAESEEFWPTIDEVIGMPREEFKRHSLKEKIQILMRGYTLAISQRPHTLAILSWSLMESNPITQLLEDRRLEVGQEGHELLFEGEDLSKLDPKFDIDVVLVVLNSALVYLGLRRMHQPDVAGIDFSTDEAWGRLSNAINYVLDAVDQYSQTHSVGKAQRSLK